MIQRLFFASILLLLWTPSTGTAQIFHVAAMTAPQLKDLDRNKTVVIIPGGILEQHGPYLPSYTDGYRNDMLAQDLANAIVERPGWSALIFPTIPLGAGGANEIGRKYVFDGTYAVRSNTLRSIFMDIGSELGEAGFKWVFVLHGHGAPSHHRALNQAADFFSDTYDGIMVNLQGATYDDGEGDNGAANLLSEEAIEKDGFTVHAGFLETSLIMYLRPDLIGEGLEHAIPFTGKNLNELVEIAKADSWLGYFGAPSYATVAYGVKIYNQRSRIINSLALKILDGFDPSDLPRWGDISRGIPEQAAIDADASERERKIEEKQKLWLQQNEN